MSFLSLNYLNQYCNDLSCLFKRESLPIPSPVCQGKLTFAFSLSPFLSVSLLKRQLLPISLLLTSLFSPPLSCSVPLSLSFSASLLFSLLHFPLFPFPLHNTLNKYPLSLHGVPLLFSLLHALQLPSWVRLPLWSTVVLGPTDCCSHLGTCSIFTIINT